MRSANGRLPVVAVLLLTVLAVSILLATLVYPKVYQVRAARLRAQRLQQELSRTTALVQAKGEVEQRHLAARRGIQTIIARIPQGPQVPGLIATLDQAIIISGVQLAMISFASGEQVADASTQSAGIGTLGISIQVRGSFPEARRFVAAIESASRAMAIDRIAMSASAGGVLADLAVRSFYLRP